MGSTGRFTAAAAAAAAARAAGLPMDVDVFEVRTPVLHGRANPFGKRGAKTNKS